MFLDFLYPPQALAFLRRARQPKPQLWERGNARRLPEGFVLARGYASRSREQAGVEEHNEGHELHSVEEELETSRDSFNSIGGREMSNDGSQYMPFSRNTSGSTSEQQAVEGYVPSSDDNSYADSPADLAELGSDGQEKLRNIMSSNRSTATRDDPQRSRLAAEQAWAVYESLDEGIRENLRLKRELLLWLTHRGSKIASSHCAELYESMPLQERILQVYEAALSAYLDLQQIDRASALHQEALTNIENGHQISRTLFRQALDRQEWKLACQTEAEHHARYADSNQASQIRIFWLHVSEIPELLAKAVKLRRDLGELDPTRDSHTVAFRKRFSREAISKEFLRPDDMRSKPGWEKQIRPLRPGIRMLFDDIASDTDAPDFFSDFLNAVIGTYSVSEYSKMHRIVAYVYQKYRDMRGVQPRENLLLAFLRQLVRYTETRHTVRTTRTTLTITDIVDDFEKYYGKVSKRGVWDLLRYHAKLGKLEEFQHWLEYLRSKFPDWADQAGMGMLWTTIEIHARRANLDGAQQAFAEAKRIATEHNDEPEIRCWNSLLRAHERVDDLEGSLTNLQNLIDYANAKPDEYSFHPIAQMLARRGDVEGVEDLLHQYDRLCGKQRTTALLASLLTAHVNNGDVATAENILQETVSGPREDRAVGSLTGCSNIVLTAHAMRRDIDATRRTYEWMRKESIALNGDTFAALMQSLVYFRQVSAAKDIMKTMMKEHNVEPTAHHYGIVMAGYVNTRSFDLALWIYSQMMKANIKPTSSTHTLYLKAKAIKEGDNKGRNLRDENNLALDDTMKDLEQLLANDDGEEAAYRQPGLGMHLRDTPTGTPAAYFDFLVFVHGQRRCFQAVKTLYQRYKAKLEENGAAGEKTPTRLLTFLMYAYLRAFNHTGVEECWNLAKEQADLSTARVHVPYLRSSGADSAADDSETDVDALELKPPESRPKLESQVTAHKATAEPKQTLMLDRTEGPRPTRPVSSRAHILSRPLRYYLISLNAQSRLLDMIRTVIRVLNQGYTLDKPTWNYFIELLCRSTPPLALLAFTLTERYLTPNFPGWSRKTRFRPREQNYKEKTQYFQVRAIRPDVLMPQYPTLVRLGAAMLEIRRFEAQGRRGMRYDVPKELEKYVGTTREIRAKAAKTVNIVQTMPTIADSMQSRLLRRDGS